jgi:hypothetical protein
MTKQSDQYSKKEAAQRFEAALKGARLVVKRGGTKQTRARKKKPAR